MLIRLINQVLKRYKKNMFALLGKPGYEDMKAELEKDYNMRIIIDGDACPSIPIIESIANENNIEVLIYCDINHYIRSDYSTVKL